jgi:hypothetical protein
MMLSFLYVVLQRFLHAVLQRLARMLVRLQKDLEDVKAALNGGKNTEPVVEVEGQGFWSRSMVRQLKLDAVARGYKGAVAVGDIAAKHAGRRPGGCSRARRTGPSLPSTRAMGRTT